jgi:hypothetical protein
MLPLSWMQCVSASYQVYAPAIIKRFVSLYSLGQVHPYWPFISFAWTYRAILEHVGLVAPSAWWHVERSYDLILSQLVRVVHSEVWYPFLQWWMKMRMSDNYPWMTLACLANWNLHLWEPFARGITFSSKPQPFKETMWETNSNSPKYIVLAARWTLGTWVS